jgi:glutathione synthase/RimK-type ligase-like ATP-grasp enzyme
MVFGKKRSMPDPFFHFKQKRSVYYDFFKMGHTAGHDMFLANGLHCHIDGYTFADTLLYNGKKFIQHNENITADFILDRSGSLAFPGDKLIRVLNPLQFKSFCASKIAMHTILADVMPKTFFIRSTIDLQNICLLLDEHHTYVLKPSTGLGGKGIIFGTPTEISRQSIEIDKEYVLQEFVDTSRGIPHITDSYHDLRVVLLDNKIVWITVRTPKKDSLLANVAQGGTIRDITDEALPACVVKTVSTVKNIITKNYSQPLLYSIDMGVSNGRAYVFELNDQIGFPNETMFSCKKFTRKLVETMSEFC